MATFKFTNIDASFEKVSSSREGETTIVLNNDTGEILCRSKATGEDQIGELEYTRSPGTFVQVPHKNDLDLGANMVLEFAEHFMPEDYYKIRSIFKTRGAYRKFKVILDQKRMLQAWEDFESKTLENALRKWCKGKGIQLED